MKLLFCTCNISHVTGVLSTIVDLSQQVNFERRQEAKEDPPPPLTYRSKKTACPHPQQFRRKDALFPVCK